MSRFTTGRAFAFGAFTFFLIANPISAQQEAAWTWEDNLGEIRTRAELDRILKEHWVWVDSNHKSGTKAELSHAYLVDADLRYAHLDGAYLSDADLSKAQFDHVDLARAEFEPKGLPELRGIAAGMNLQLLTYRDNPDALVQLRKQFMEAGFREQERKITYALKRREAELSWEGCRSRKTGDETRAILWSSDSNLANCGSFILNRVFFDWTCQYGLSPGRPLSLGVLLWLLCSVLYFVCIHAPGKTGLYRVYAPNLQENSSVPRRVEEILPAEMKAHGVRRLLQFF